jgi:glycosyltransferase involved in cell wall biosynthesis
MPERRVVVDARALQYPVTGIGRYVESLLDWLPPGMTGAARPSAPVEPYGLRVRQMRPDLWNVLWNEVCLNRLLREADAYWSTVGYVPWTRPKRCHVVTTIHDVMHRTHPRSMNLHRRLDMENAVLASVRRADVLTTTCRFVSEQLKERYGRAADVLVPPAPSVVPTTAAAADRMRARLAEGRPEVRQWVLTVGQEIPRKNFVRLADGVAQLPGVGLVIAGPPVDHNVGAELASRVDSTPLLRLGYTSSDDLAALYAAVDVVAFVSLLEGYGMPLLDARSLGVRLLVSDIPPLPEHAGAHAVVCDALSPDAIARGLRTALDSGRPPAERLNSWADSAAALADALGVRSRAATEQSATDAGRSAGSAETS